jgi:hypothetical protein
VSTMIERDANIPPLAELLAELDRARQIAGPILRERAAQRDMQPRQDGAYRVTSEPDMQPRRPGAQRTTS